jgi:hypothetical protein
MEAAPMGQGQTGDEALARYRQRAERIPDKLSRFDALVMVTALEAVMELHGPTPMAFHSGFICRVCFTSFPCATRAGVDLTLTGGIFVQDDRAHYVTGVSTPPQGV